MDHVVLGDQIVRSLLGSGSFLRTAMDFMINKLGLAVEGLGCRFGV